MKLSRYVPRGGAFAFAKRIDVHPNSIYRALRGHKPSLRLALKIVAGTGGEVTLVDLGFSEEEARQVENFQRGDQNDAA